MRMLVTNSGLKKFTGPSSSSIKMRPLRLIQA